MGTLLVCCEMVPYVRRSSAKVLLPIVAPCLQEMRTYSQCEEAGKNVGFELVESRDLATACQPCGAW